MQLVSKLLDIQKSIDAVTKSSTNPHFKSKYADLNEVLGVAKEACNKAGLLILQLGGADSSGKFVSTEITDGTTTISSKIYFSGSEDNMQKLGAAVTYARRFGLLSLLALESEDDDYETAVGRGGSMGSNGKAGIGGQRAQASKGSPVEKEERSELAAKTITTKDREALNALIRQTGKVLADMKKQPLEETAKLVKSYGVTKTEELMDEQADEVYLKLKEKLK